MNRPSGSVSVKLDPIEIYCDIVTLAMTLENFGGSILKCNGERQMYSNETLPLPLLLGLSIPLEGSKDFVQYLV